jgi:3-oxoacyl-[acyl-carrier protein] reductase
VQRLAGKVALVSGGSRGIGRAIVERLAEEGCRVLFTFHRAEEQARSVEKELNGRGFTVATMQGAVERLADCEAAVEAARERFGELSVVVNNAGMIRPKAFLNMVEDDWRAVVEVELFGTMNLAHAALPSLMRAEGNRSIINLGSIADAGSPGSVPHSAAKGGVASFTRALAQELGPFGVRVNCVSPGIITTEGAEAIGAKKMEKWMARTPLRRFGMTTEIANAVVFLASDDASFVAGEVLHVNGGIPWLG